MKSIFRQSYALPMLLSIVLLSAFLYYFLKTEYDKEKQAIVIENRDEAFVTLFTNIKDAGQIEWKTDSLGNDIIVKLEKISEVLDGDGAEALRGTAIDPGNSSRIIKHTELLQINETSDSIITIHEIESDSVPGNLKLRQSFSKNMVFEKDTLPGIGLLELHSRMSASDSGHTFEMDVNPVDVLKRMTGEIGFSIFLLVSVLSAFVMLSRSLRKEQQLSELRNDFLANITHELKTPVSTVSVALEALSNFDAKDDPALRKEYIDISRAELSRLDMLVDNALNISLFEKGKIVLDKEQIDLSNLLDELEKNLEFQLASHNATLDIQKQGGEYIILGDKTHLTNVIYNLLENAVKYSGESPLVTIRLKEQPSVFVLEVADNGIGIEDEYIDKVFDKFFRVPQGDRHNVKGYGLGLSYVRQIAEDHGGAISLESKKGKGSTFKIQFPKYSRGHV